jgi:DNA mismatch repair ATPase MutS
LVSLQEEILSHTDALYTLAEKIAWLDLLTSQALYAKEHQFVKPQISESPIFEIQ